LKAHRENRLIRKYKNSCHLFAFLAKIAPGATPEAPVCYRDLRSGAKIAPGPCAPSSGGLPVSFKKTNQIFDVGPAPVQLLNQPL
jgi:hypothetical protein